MNFKKNTEKSTGNVGCLGMFIGAYMVVNTTMLAGLYLGELIVDRISPSEKKELILKFKENKRIQSLATQGYFDNGKFETLEGKIMYLNDNNKVSEGKFFPNEYIHDLKKDSVYKLNVIGNEKLGYTILDVKPE